jgi:hypothetical protein
MKLHRLYLAFLIIFPAASAPAQEQPNPWKDYPAKEVARPITAATNGYLLSLALRSLTATDNLNPNGQRESRPSGLSLFNLDFQLRYGITPKWEAGIGLPYLTARTKELASGAIGNAYLETRYSLWANDSFEVAAGIRVSIPTGDAEYHFDLENGKVIPENFRTGNPGYDYYPQIEARYRTGASSVRLRAEWIFTGPGETVLNRIGGNDQTESVNPGDGYRIVASYLHQATDRFVFPLLTLDYLTLGESIAKDFNFDDRTELFEARAGLIYQVSPEFEALAGIGFPLAGRNVPYGAPLWLELRSRF